MTPLERLHRRGLYSVLKSHLIDKKYADYIEKSKGVTAIDRLSEIVKEVNARDQQRLDKKTTASLKREIKKSIADKGKTS